MDAPYSPSEPFIVDARVTEEAVVRFLHGCAGVDAAAIVCGHTHGQFQRTVGR